MIGSGGFPDGLEGRESDMKETVPKIGQCLFDTEIERVWMIGIKKYNKGVWEKGVRGNWRENMEEYNWDLRIERRRESVWEKRKWKRGRKIKRRSLSLCVFLVPKSKKLRREFASEIIRYLDMDCGGNYQAKQFSFLFFI